MKVSTSFVICGLPEAAVGRAAVVVDVAETLDDGGQETLVDPAGGEVCVAEVGGLVRVVELEVERLGDLIICGMISSTPVSGVRDASESGRAGDVPSLLPAARKRKGKRKERIRGRHNARAAEAWGGDGLTKDDDRRVVSQPLHVLLRLRLHRFRERRVRRVLCGPSLSPRPMACALRHSSSPARIRT